MKLQCCLAWATLAKKQIDNHQTFGLLCIQLTWHHITTFLKEPHLNNFDIWKIRWKLSMTTSLGHAGCPFPLVCSTNVKWSNTCKHDSCLWERRGLHNLDHIYLFNMSTLFLHGFCRSPCEMCRSHFELFLTKVRPRIKLYHSLFEYQ